jgi:hypothetical protein
VVSIVAPNIYETLSIDDSAEMKSAVLESVFSGDAFAPILSGIVGRVGTFDFGGLEDEIQSVLTEYGSNANIENLIGVLKQRIQYGFPEFLGKAIVYNLAQSELLMSPMSADGMADFSELVEEVKSKINKALPEYISAHVAIEVQRAIEEADERERELLEDLPEPIRMRSIPRQPQPINVVVNPPNITMPNINITSPIQEKKEDDMQIIINNNPENVDLGNKKQGEVLKSLADSILEIKSGMGAAPIVNVSVSPTPITNEVNVERAQVNVLPTPVNITNEVIVNPTPVEITNNVEPTPLEVNVHLPPKSEKREIKIVRDSENTWHGEATEKEA